MEKSLFAVGCGIPFILLAIVGIVAFANRRSLKRTRMRFVATPRRLRAWFD
jgi:hypothetical protein